MNAPRTAQERYNLITRQLLEVNGGEVIMASLATGGSPKTFWATAPTGKPHIAYLVSFAKIADFVEAGVDVTILLCDVWAFCAKYVHSWELIAERTKYYKRTMTAALETLGVPTSKVHFVESSSYELTREFTMDNYKLCALADQQDARNATLESREGSKISCLFCPGLTCLGEHYLDADFQFGGEDQRGLFEFNDRFLPQLGYRKRAHLMNAMVPGLTGLKMSSSDPDSKIEFLDTPEAVRSKISRAVCEDGELAGNGVLPLIKHILMPISELRLINSASANNARLENQTGSVDNRHLFAGVDAPEGTLFTVAIAGSPARHYKSYDEIEKEFEEKTLSTEALKVAVANAINQLLDPIREMFKRDEIWQNLDKSAYPNS